MENPRFVESKQEQAERPPLEFISGKMKDASHVTISFRADSGMSDEKISEILVYICRTLGENVVLENVSPGEHIFQITFPPPNEDDEEIPSVSLETLNDMFSTENIRRVIHYLEISHEGAQALCRAFQAEERRVLKTLYEYGKKSAGHMPELHIATFVHHYRNQKRLTLFVRYSQETLQLDEFSQIFFETLAEFGFTSQIDEREVMSPDDSQAGKHDFYRLDAELPDSSLETAGLFSRVSKRVMERLKELYLKNGPSKNKLRLFLRDLDVTV